MNPLFEPTELNGLQLKNRFVRAATWEGMADESGGCTPRLVELYARLAQGEVGLIITGHSYVLPDGKRAPRRLGIYKDALIPGLKSLTQAVHEGGGRIVIQISYGGYYLSKSRVERMTPTDIQGVAQGFGQAAARASRGRVRRRGESLPPTAFSSASSFARVTIPAPMPTAARLKTGPGRFWKRSRPSEKK